MGIAWLVAGILTLFGIERVRHALRSVSPAPA
jgi:hypothetical protein